MYKIIDSCYGQNLGLEGRRTDSEIVSLVLRGEEQLGEWQSSLAPLQMLVYKTPLSPRDLEKMEVGNKYNERFIIVLSVRYHNLRILLHRPLLEGLLDACGRMGTSSTSGPPSSSGLAGNAGDLGMVRHLSISSVETCVNSAIVVISMIRTVVLSTGWQRDLLGAWNYSLFYSKLWTHKKKRRIMKRDRGFNSTGSHTRIG